MASKFPSYRHHKASGRAFVQWKPLYGNRRHYLPGKHNSPESLAEYAAILKQVTAPPKPSPKLPPSEVRTIADLIVAFQSQRGFGNTSGKFAARKLLALHGRTRIDDFGPRALQEVRQAMIDAGWCVSHINQSVVRLRYVFKWGVAAEYVAPERYGALKLVQGLKPGETSAPVRPKVKPVAWSDVAVILDSLAPMIAAMVQVQGFSGMRSDELCSLRKSELDRSGEVWIYRKEEHKTAHHGKEKIICFGPRSQALLTPYLDHDEPYIFAPKIAEQERKTARAASRKTPLYGKAKTRRPSFQSTRSRYDARTYRRTLTYAFVKLANERMRKPDQLKPRSMERPKKGESLREWLSERGVVLWHPHQLRHSRGTETRATYGIEGAQVVLGNSLEATQIYAEKSLALALKIARETG